jgi:triphosphatase
VGTGVEPEPVHQARVALRRLRSVIRLFQPALDCPELTEADSALRDLARLLGPARDWDVFLGTTAPAVARAFADEPALNRLRAAAQRRRQDAYAALAAWLRGPEPARLGVELACLLVAQPWERTAAGGAEAHSLRAYAAHALRRRARRLKRTDADLSDVPIEALHALRLHAKRLRYACEVFAPLFPGRHAARMIRRLSALQEALGHLNDGAVAGALMAELGPAGRGHGGGLVRGYVAGHQAAALAPAQRAWQRLRALEPFWM